MEKILQSKFSEFKEKSRVYKNEVMAEILEAFEFADRSPFPSSESLGVGVYHND